VLQFLIAGIGSIHQEGLKIAEKVWIEKTQAEKSGHQAGFESG
jgi:hypothetical protein